MFLPKILFWGVRRNRFSPIKLFCPLRYRLWQYVETRHTASKLIEIFTDAQLPYRQIVATMELL
jgi:hypothetical protein